jgi:hypothetical protein
MAEVGGAVAVDFESERFSYLLDNSRFSYLLDPKGFCIFGSLEFLAGTVPAGAGFIQRLSVQSGNRQTKEKWESLLTKRQEPIITA